MKIPLAELVLSALGSTVNADMPTHRRILELIRHAILSHQLQGGSKLPSSRNLAKDIGPGRLHHAGGHRAPRDCPRR